MTKDKFKWEPSKRYPGVRFRKHESRKGKNGIDFDCYYSIRYKINGKDKAETLGWNSQDWTELKAFKLLTEIKENIKMGKGPQSLAEMREANQEKERLEKETAQRRKLQAMTFSEFWNETYWPESELSKKRNSVRTELGRVNTI